MILLSGWCGTVKRVVWDFEDGGMVFDDGGVQGWCCTFKRVGFRDDVVLLRG